MQLAEFLQLLDLEEIEDNLFRGRSPATSRQRVFGGQVAAHALAAAYHTVDSRFRVHSLHSYFLRAGDPNVPIIYDVDSVRDGRSFCTRRVLARQHGHAIFMMTLSFQIPETGFEHQDLMPPAPPPQECIDLGELVLKRNKSVAEDEAWPSEWKALEVRLADTSAPQGTLDASKLPARTRLWIRVNGQLPPDHVTQAAAFTYATDMTLIGVALRPHNVFVTSPGMQVASLDHTIWFHRPFRPDHWWLYDQHSPAAAGARGLALARVFTQDGLLVASVAQEGLIRRHPVQ